MTPAGGARARIADVDGSAGYCGRRNYESEPAMYRVTMAAGCGCCLVEEMLFRSIARAQAAIGACGWTSSGTIRDDAGVTHRGLDTFYGFSAERVRDRRGRRRARKRKLRR